MHKDYDNYLYGFEEGFVFCLASIKTNSIDLFQNIKSFSKDFELNLKKEKKYKACKGNPFQENKHEVVTDSVQCNFFKHALKKIKKLPF